MMRRLQILAVLTGLFAGCATAGSRPDSASFRVETNVPDATVWIDDHLVGAASELARPGKHLVVGFHRIEIRHPAYYSFFTEIQPNSGDDVIVRAQLHELVQ